MSTNEPRPLHVRVTRIHATGAATCRDVDIRDREQWKRVARGAKETMEQGGEHHMRPLYPDDSMAVSTPAPLKVRVEVLEAGIREALERLNSLSNNLPTDDPAWIAKDLEALLKKPEAKEAGN